MKINPAKLTVEDFKEQQSWITPLFQALNQFTGDVVRAFSNQLSVEDNLFQEVKEIKFRNSSGDYPLKFRTKFTVFPRGILPIYLFDHSTNSFSTLAPWVVWSYSDGQVVISNISGLTPDVTYSIRLNVIYG